MEDNNLVGELKAKINSPLDGKATTDGSEVVPSDKKEIRKGSLVNNIDDYDKSQWIALRTAYANKLYYLLCGEIVGVFALLLLIGFDIIKIPESTLNITIVAITAHTFGLVKEIVTNLFKK